MAGSSALSKLKTQLHSTNSAANNRSSSAKKSRSSVSQAYRSAKNNDIAAKLNSFDTIEEKKKFKVITKSGKLEKGIIKNEPAKSRAAGIELRKRTLLPQLLARNSTSSFIDHRFGESASSSLTLEEKALQRFTAERTSKLSSSSKQGRFNLEEDDVNAEEGLTHGGRKLGFGDEDELEVGGWGGGATMLNDGGVINSNREPLIARRMNAVAGGEQENEEEEEPARKRSKAEIMMEVVAKSKAYKHERQKVKSADDDMRYSLDAGLGDLRAMLGGGIPVTDSSLQSGKKSSKKSKQIQPQNDDDDSEEEDGMAGVDDDDDEDEDEDDADDSEDDDEGTKELTDKELEEALSSKSGVDRDLLRKLIGGLSSGKKNKSSKDDASSDEEEDSAPPPPLRRIAAPVVIAPLPSQAQQFSLASAFDSTSSSSTRPTFPASFITNKEVDADPYDAYVRLLAMEPRAQASNRLKTSLELARDEVDRLSGLEKKRLRRARGEESESEPEDEMKNKKRKRAPQGDDLEDDFLGEGSDEEEGGEDEGLGKGLVGGFGNQVIELKESVAVATATEEDDSEEEDDDDEGENEMDLQDLEGSDEEETGDIESLVPGAKVTVATKEKKSRDWTGQSVPSIASLPFTFPCPTSHGDFLRLLGTAGIVPGEGDEDAEREGTVLVIKRIRTLYHPGLGSGNKEKLQMFTAVLLDHVLHLSSLSTTTSTTTSPYRSINALLPHLLTLSHAYPLTTAALYLGKLALLSKNFSKGVASGALDHSARTWPGLAELNVLRLVGMTWSTSDLSHPVAAAALLMIGQYLSPQSRIRTLEDIAAGLFLCSMAVQYEEKSRRFIPEVVAFLLQTLGVLLPNSFKSKNTTLRNGVKGQTSGSRVIPGTFSASDWGMDHVKHLKLRSTTVEFTPTAPLSLPETLRPVSLPSSSNGNTKMKNSNGTTKTKKVVVGGEEEEPTAVTQRKVDLVTVTLKLVENFATMYVSLEAFIEIIEPVQLVLEGVVMGRIPECIQNEITTLRTSLQRMITLSKSSRQPLLLQSHKPIPLATFIPKFDESYNPNRAFDPDTERAEKSKLKKLYHSEKKGAIRELRKDNRFLAAEESKRKSLEAEVYKKKIATIMGGLADERGEEKQFEASRARGKRQDKARRK